MHRLNHSVSTMLLNTGIAQNVFSLTRFFPETYLTFSQFPDISLTAVKFPNISRFSSQVVTLNKAQTSFAHTMHNTDRLNCSEITKWQGSENLGF